MTVPPQGKVACKLAGSLPCAGSGAFTVVLIAGGGYTLTSLPTPFSFNTSQLAAASSGSQCAEVRDEFKGGEGRVGGALVSGTRPNGRLCGSRTFTYSVKFGPYAKCGTFKVRPPQGPGWCGGGCIGRCDSGSIPPSDCFDAQHHT